MSSITEDNSTRSGHTLDGLLTALMNRSPILRILVAGRLLGPLGALVGTLLFSLTLSLLLFMGVGLEQNLGGLLLLVGLMALIAGLVGASRLRSQLLLPLVELERAVADVCEGEPWSNLP